MFAFDDQAHLNPPHPNAHLLGLSSCEQRLDGKCSSTLRYPWIALPQPHVVLQTASIDPETA